jgi:hypothetical protein
VISARVLLGLMTALVLAALPGAAAAAEFGIVPGSLAIRTLDSAGLPDNRAGAHPDRLQIDFTLSSGSGTSPRDLIFELPPGLAGSPNSVPACPRTTYDEIACGAKSQVGNFSESLEPHGEKVEEPIYNIEPPPNQIAQFGAGLIFVKLPFAVQLRPDDFGLTMGLTELSQLPASEGRIELWGVPVDHQKGALSPRLPFVTTPAGCDPMTVTLRARSWREGTTWTSTTAASAPLEGCRDLPFEPDLGFEVTDPTADTSTGMRASLTFPTYLDPDGLVGAQAKNVEIEFPPGMSVSPAGASGLGACADAQFGLGTDGQVTCPASSKVGTVVLGSAQLHEPLSGDVYLGRERPDDRFRLFVAASGPGVQVKLTGSLHVDRESGQVTASLGDLPQFPVNRMALSLEGGSRGLLATPLSCGDSVASATFEPYGGGPSVDSSAPVTIGSHVAGAPCSDTNPFAPRVVAGSTNSKAGQRTGFSLTLHRQDGEQLPDGLGVELPAGLSPALRSVELCSGSDADAATCSPASKIGSATVEVGAGPNPAALTGQAYLTGPYRGAPFGLALAFHAAIGPFDLGQLVVRGKLEIDPLSGRATLDMDSLPDAFEGIPLRFQTIGLDLNRPGFLRNPTSCSPASVKATIHAKGGASAVSASRFSLRGCDSLPFQPTFSMALSGRSDLHRHGRPDLRLSARLPRGSTNLRTVKVSLPRLLQLNIAGLREVCTRRDAMEGRCPRGSRVGSSYARTPLLKEKLAGPVFVVQPQDGGSPDLWSSVEGMGVRLNLRGETAEKDGRTAVTLTNLPDLSLSAFTMRLDGGEDGVLSLRSGLCADGRARRIASPVSAEGQDGALRRMQVRLGAKARCGVAASPAPTAKAAHGAASR